MEKISILLTDDHVLLRESWACILNADPRFNVIAETGTGEEAAELARDLHPDIVIMDINLPGINGIEAATLIKEYSPVSKIICISIYSQPAYARKMMQCGAMGYVTKASSKEEMINAILEVSNNRKYICEDIKNILSDQMMDSNEHAQGLQSLSLREMDVINHVKKGMNSREIAEALHISIKTVEVHRYNILKKLKLKNVAAMVNYMNNN